MPRPEEGIDCRGTAWRAGACCAAPVWTTTWAAAVGAEALGATAGAGATDAVGAAEGPAIAVAEVAAVAAGIAAVTTDSAALGCTEAAGAAALVCDRMTNRPIVMTSMLVTSARKIASGMLKRPFAPDVRARADCAGPTGVAIVPGVGGVGSRRAAAGLAADECDASWRNAARPGSSGA